MIHELLDSMTEFVRTNRLQDNQLHKWTPLPSNIAIIGWENLVGENLRFVQSTPAFFMLVKCFD